jgi:hypothetical protein
VSDCPGVCNAAFRRAEKARAEHGAEHDLKPQPGAPVWCRRCATIVRVCLHELDDLAAILEAEAAGKRGQAGDRVSGSAGSPSPAPKVDDAEEIVATLEGWESAWRDRHGWPQKPLRGRSGTRSIGCVSWLARHLDGILADPDMAPDFGTEVLRLHRMAQRASSTSPDMVRKPLPCPRCDRRSLIAKGGAKHIECEAEGCGRLLTLDEYDEMVAATARAVS